MSLIRLCVSMLLITASFYSKAQADSALQFVDRDISKYIRQVDHKMDKYNDRLVGRTEKTLSKLSRWENKIKIILQNVNPDAANRLFGNNQLTFSGALERYKKGEVIIIGQKAKYDEYRDKLTTSLGYLDQEKDKLDKKYIATVKSVKQKTDDLEMQEANNEAIEQFIKERRRQLIREATKYIGNSKYLSKISAETGLYIGTIQNYKELFRDKKKAEEMVLGILNKIPAYTKFVQENGMLAKLFGSPASGAATPNLAGLQTRAGVNTLIQNQIAAGGPNGRQEIMENIQTAQTELNKLRDKVLKAGVNSSGSEMLADEYGKFNPQRSKTFLQKLELGTNLQTTKSNGYFPATTDLGFSIGYKQSNSLTLGIGASYKLGLGNDINHIKFSSAGAGLRSFIDYKLKKSFWLSGGAEMNYHNSFGSVATLQQLDAWQTSALLGLSKKYNVGKKMKGNMQLLYDFLYLKASPVKQSPLVFRVGYSL